jgi:hypothetical protein
VPVYYRPQRHALSVRSRHLWNAVSKETDILIGYKCTGKQLKQPLPRNNREPRCGSMWIWLVGRARSTAHVSDDFSAQPWLYLDYRRSAFPRKLSVYGRQMFPIPISLPTHTSWTGILCGLDHDRGVSHLGEAAITARSWHDSSCQGLALLGGIQ